MFDVVNLAMFRLLEIIHGWVHSYGWAVVVVTLGIRLLLWPLNTTQTRNMRKMQVLQPKIKAIQDRYKSDPAKMQEAMMKFYAENQFNPFGGCLPMLVQLPIFIGLYGALQSPMFLMESGHEPFYFIQNLSQTLRSHAGESFDQKFDVQQGDHFSVSKQVTLVFGDGNTVGTTLGNTRKSIVVTPTPVVPNEPIDVRFDMDQLGDNKAQFDKISQIKLLIINDATKELEKATFTKQNVPLLNDKKQPVLDKTGQPEYEQAFTTQFPTELGKQVFNGDVAILILLYAIISVLYQKIMSPASAPTPTDPQAAMQAKMAKLMPLGFVVMLAFIPLPAGVLIYLVITMALMFVQTAWVNYTEDKKHPTAKPGDQVVEAKAE